MPEYLAPGVYLEEVAFGVHPIEAVDMAVAGIVGVVGGGPTSEPVELTSPEELTAVFGAAAAPTPVGRAVEGFFGNGGRRAWVTQSADVVDPHRALALVPDEVGLVCLPDTATMDPDDAAAVAAAGVAHAERIGALFLIDAPETEDVVDWVTGHLGLSSADSALAVPRLMAADDVAVSPAGHVAGLIARTDAASGVWTAPAGAEATLAGVSAPESSFTQFELDRLVAAGINPVRSVPPDDRVVVWGARTLASDPEWRYVPVRRMRHLVERSIRRSIAWVVFEPNEEPLWDSIRRVTEDFLIDLWRRGAFQGTKPEEAFFVRCDPSTMTRADIVAGRLVVEIGFAPLRPAEFITIRLEHWTETAAPASAVALLVDAAKALRSGSRPAATIVITGSGRRRRRIAAEYLATAIDRPLISVDVSRVVSKYIGETEKNLVAAVAHAERLGAVLFFDEADALFGRGSSPLTERLARALAFHDGLVTVSCGYDGCDRLAVERVFGARPVIVSFAG
jgi:hypothetical protein